MTDRLNPEAFLAAKDAAQEAFQANKDWHDITTAMLNAYDKSIALPAPRTITTVEELEGLPYGSLVRANNGNEFYKSPVFDYPWSQGREHDRCASGYLEKLAPITVIHAPRKDQ